MTSHGRILHAGGLRWARNGCESPDKGGCRRGPSVTTRRSPTRSALSTRLIVRGCGRLCGRGHDGVSGSAAPKLPRRCGSGDPAQKSPGSRSETQYAATASALPRRWRWELRVPWPRIERNSARRLGRRHLTRRRSLLMHQITSIPAEMSPSEAQTPLPVPVHRVVADPAPPGRPASAPPARRPQPLPGERRHGTRGRVRSPVDDVIGRSQKPPQGLGATARRHYTGPPWQAPPPAIEPPWDLERRLLSRAMRWQLEDRSLIDGNETVVFS
jgi:hypothetical protein